MSIRWFIIALITASVIISCNQNKESDLESESVFAGLTGPYLGQKPPGMTPELFAPGLLSAGHDEFKMTFSPDGREFCYNLGSPAAQWIVEPTGLFRKSFMMFTCEENGHWIEPREFSFGSDRNSYYPFFSPDGKKLFFSSERTGKMRKWYAEKHNGDWSHPKEVEFQNGFQSDGLFISVALNGNLYFGMSPDGENTFIYMSKYENGLYSIPEKLNNMVNEAGGGHHPYIAPDESYLIFDYPVSKEGTEEEDLYISFRSQTGEWMKPENMGRNINSVYRDKRAFVSFDGKYLFFISNRIDSEIPSGPLTLKQLQQLTGGHADSFQHIYWVDAKVIEELRPDNQ